MNNRQKGLISLILSILLIGLLHPSSTPITTAGGPVPTTSWVITTQTEFEACTLERIDTTTTPGSTMLAKNPWNYRQPITIGATGTLLEKYQILISTEKDVVLDLHMDEGVWYGDNKVHDSSYHRNDGFQNVAGAKPAWVDGKFGKALSFDGVDDIVVVPDSASLTSPRMTWMAWIKPASWDGPSADWYRAYWLDGRGHGYMTYSDGPSATSPGLNVTIYTGTLYELEVPLPSVGEWHHVVGRYDGSTLKIFVDGEEKGSKAASGDITVFSTDLRTVLGGYQGGGYFENGITDEVRIYNRALSAEEIKVQYQSGVARFFQTVRPGGGDVRFTDSDQTTRLPYWMEEFTSNENIKRMKAWVKVPEIPATGTKTIYMYYGNPNAVSEGNGDATFIFFDDFPGTAVDTTKWAVGGDVTVADGIVTLFRTGGVDAKIYNGNYNYPVRLRMRQNIKEANCSLFGFINSDLSTGTGFTVTQYDNTQSRHQGRTRIATDVHTAFSLPGGFFYVYEVRRYAAKQEYLINDRLEVTHTQSDTMGAKCLTAAAYTYDGAQISIDWVFIAKLADHEPAFSVGAEEDVRYEVSGSIVTGSRDAGVTRPIYKNILWTESLPAGTDIELFVCVSADGATWDAWTGPYTINTGQQITSENKRYVKWKAVLTTNNVLNTPRLDDITLQYIPNAEPNAPTNLAPMNMARTLTPTLSWTFSDNNLPNDEQTGYRIQVGTVAGDNSLWDNTVKGGAAGAGNAVTYAGGDLTEYANKHSTIHWRVMNWDYHGYPMDGLPANWGAQTFIINRLPVVTKLLTEGKVNPALLTTFNPVFGWCFSDEDAYDVQSARQIQVGSVENGSNLWDNTASTRDNFVVYGGAGLDRGVTYHVRVRVRDNFEATFGDWYRGTFKINRLPVAGNLKIDGLVPLVKLPSTAINPAFSWAYADNDPEHPAQTHYYIQVGTNPDAKDMWDTGELSGDISSRRYAGGPLSVGVKYYVQVKVKDGLEWSRWTQGEFILNQVPKASNLLTEGEDNPTKIGTVTPTFSWGYSDPDTDNQFKYWIQVGSTEGGSDMWNFVSPERVTENSKLYAGATLSRGVTYYVRISVFDNWDWSKWISGSFRIRELPVSSDLKVDGLVNPTRLTNFNPTLGWTYYDAEGDVQVEFMVQVGTAFGGSNMWNFTATGDNTSVAYAGSALSRGVTYYWRVKVKDNTGDWQAVWSTGTFRLNQLPAAGSPKTMGQTNPVKVATLNPTFSWAYNDPDGDLQVKVVIQVGSTPDNKDIWDPGEVAVKTQNLTYTGPFLKAGTKYYWRVMVSDGYEYSGWISGDFTMKNPPRADNIVINIGAVYTNSRGVILDLAASDEADAIIAMSFSMDNRIWSLWEPYWVSKTFTLSPGDGTKYVFFRVKDTIGSISNVVHDTITLDTAKPAIAIGYPMINATIITLEPTVRAYVYDVNPLTISMLVDGKPVKAVYNENDYSFIYTPTLGEGEHTVEITAFDAAGNESTIKWSFSVYVHAEEYIPKEVPVEKRFFVETSKLKYEPGETVKIYVTMSNPLTTPYADTLSVHFDNVIVTKSVIVPPQRTEVITIELGIAPEEPGQIQVYNVAGELLATASYDVVKPEVVPPVPIEKVPLFYVCVGVCVVVAGVGVFLLRRRRVIKARVREVELEEI